MPITVGNNSIVTNVILALLCVTPLALAVDTTIKGGKMELVDKGENIHFTGGVRLEKGTDVLIADQMTTNRNRDKVHAVDNVKLNRKMENGEEWQGFGAEGFYNNNTGDGYLLGRAKQAQIIYNQVLSSTATRRMNVWADRVDFSKSNESGLAKGHVYGRTVDPETNELYEFWSENADYNRQKGTIVLYGSPQPLVLQTLGQDRKEVRGNVITYFVQNKRIISEGLAKAVFDKLSNKER